MLKAKTRNNMSSPFPLRHTLLAGFFLTLIGLAFVLLPTPEVEAKRSLIPLAINIAPEEEPEEITLPSKPEELANETTSPESSQLWQTLTVKNGDSLSSLFDRANLSAQELYQLTHSTEDAKLLRRIYPGQQIEIQVDEAQQLQALRYVKSQLESAVFTRQADGTFTSGNIQRSPTVHRQFKQASIDDSLFLAGQRAGLPQKLIMEVANIFGGVIDFVYDPRKGDKFSVLYEELYLDGEKIGNGNILAAQYQNQGDEYVAFRYEYENGTAGYFNAEGISMRKTFLRAPLDFNRISSGFNLRRKHPIHRKIRAHRGIDYAAPRGTPIFAAGDGRVVKAGYNRANGNYVFIQHGQQYTTKYLHLHKRYVKRGQKVKQRQIIGSLGSTGYATGPHLHYEFLVNGVHRNPRTILKKLPKAKTIESKEKPRFVAQIYGLQLQLAAYSGNTELALLEEGAATP